MKRTKTLSETIAEYGRRRAKRVSSRVQLCGCGCGRSLEPRVDGHRQQIGGKEVNDDCYFRELGKAIEKHPIHTPSRSPRHRK